MDRETSLVTGLLRQARAGDAEAVDRAVAIVYEELRRIARRVRCGRGTDTLTTTALVHEAYLKLAAGQNQEYTDRAHFLAVAARAMRHILIDHVRSRLTAKRGGGVHFVDLDRIEASLMSGSPFAESKADALAALDHALRRLAEQSERQVRIVECRFFAGMSIPETAAALGLSQATVKRGWSMAQAWLYRELRSSAAAEPA